MDLLDSQVSEGVPQVYSLVSLGLHSVENVKKAIFVFLRFLNAGSGARRAQEPGGFRGATLRFVNTPVSLFFNRSSRAGTTWFLAHLRGTQARELFMKHKPHNLLIVLYTNPMSSSWDISSPWRIPSHARWRRDGVPASPGTSIYSRAASRGNSPSSREQVRSSQGRRTVTERRIVLSPGDPAAQRRGRPSTRRRGADSPWCALRESFRGKFNLSPADARRKNLRQ